MNTRVLVIALVILLIAVGAYFFAMPRESMAPSVAPADGKFIPGTIQGPVTHMVFMGKDSFTPSTLAIHVGDTVLFQNNDTSPHWPASGLHPTHQICPGFDAKKRIAPGQSYTYIFATAATCPFHNHLNPKITGTITAQ